MTDRIPIGDQIEALEYAIAVLRGGNAAVNTIYIGWIGAALTTRLEAALTTLLWLRDNRAWVLASSPESPLMMAKS